MNTQLLKKGFLFESLTADELEAISEIVTEKDVIAGDYVFDEGASATSLFVIKSGTIEILKKGSGGDEQTVAHLSPGSHFGEMAFIDKEPRAAAAMAKENVKLLEIKYADLDHLINAKPPIGHNIYKALATTLCRRIRQTTNNLSSLKELKLKHL
jgi:CRP-like cAMP-binding protein